MVKTREEIKADFEKVLRKAATSVVINTSKNTIEVMRMINDTFDSALKEYIKELSKQLPEKDRSRKAAELDMAYKKCEQDNLNLDALAEMIFMVLMTE